MLESEFLAIGEQAQEISRVAAAGDQEDVLNPRVDKGLNGVKDHRLVVDRQQMFVGDFGEREEAASGSSRQYDAFHVRSFPFLYVVLAWATAWISWRLHTRTGSRRRETMAST